MIFHRARHSHPPNPERAETRSCPRRALSECARSASKKGTWPLPTHSSEFQRCLHNVPVAIRYDCTVDTADSVWRSGGRGKVQGLPALLMNTSLRQSPIRGSMFFVACRS